MSGRPDRAGTTSINTPVASIGVRGTIVEGVVGAAAAEIAAGERGVGPNVRIDPATASLILLRGPGTRTQGRLTPGAIDVTAGGRTVSVTEPMRAVFVPAPGMAPIGPFIISPRGYAQMRALLFPLLAQRLGLPIPGERPFVPYGNGQRDRPLPPPPLGQYGYPGMGGQGPGPGPGPRSNPYGAPGFPGRGSGFPGGSQGTRGTVGQHSTVTTRQPAGQPSSTPSSRPSPSPRPSPSTPPRPRPSPSPTYSPQPSPSATGVPGKP